MRRTLLLGLAAVSIAGVLSSELAAQQPPHPHLHPMVEGVVFDFDPDGVWRVPARRVAEVRSRLHREGRFEALNAPLATRSFSRTGGIPGSWRDEHGAVAGTLKTPVILLAFSDSDLDSYFNPSAYRDLIFGLEPVAHDRPFTLRTLYRAMSSGLFDIDGQVYGWVKAPEPQSYYLDACGVDDEGRRINALNCTVGRARMGEWMLHAIETLDTQGVSFASYDGTGNGTVDVVQFIQPANGGECGGAGIWAHRWGLRWAVGRIVTTSEGIVVNDYTIQSGLGGERCAASDLMGIGTMAHELGHGLGLPDLYDTSDATSAVGLWGLMAAGNWLTLKDPVWMSAWSREQLGWAYVRPLEQSGRYEIGALPANDTLFLVRPRVYNPRGEYFLLENRQRTRHPLGPGLLVWQIDSAKVATDRPRNSVNTGAIHGVALHQADGLNHLRNEVGAGPRNSGDAGDPFPGTSGNTTFGADTHPSSRLNDGAHDSGVRLSNIAHLSGGRMSLELSLAGDLVVEATHAAAHVIVNGIRTPRWAAPLLSGETVQVSVDSLQVTADGASAFAFEGWSNQRPRSHTLTGILDYDRLIAQLQAQHRLRVETQGQGRIEGAPEGALAGGTFVPEADELALVARPDSGWTFYGWSGAHTTFTDTLRLSVSGPVDLIAEFRDWSEVIVTSSEPEANVRVNGQATSRFAQAVSHGETLVLEADSLQLATDSTMAYVFVGWSNGQPARHSLKTPLDADSVVATMERHFRLRVRIDGEGTVSGAPVGSLEAGSYPSPSQSLFLEGRPASGHYFDRWSTGETGAYLSLSVSAPTELRAIFSESPVLRADQVLDHLFGLGAALSAADLAYLDRFGNANGRLDVGDVLAWIQRAGISPASDPRIATLTVETES